MSLLLLPGCGVSSVTGMADIVVRATIVNSPGRRPVANADVLVIVDGALIESAAALRSELSRQLEPREENVGPWLPTLRSQHARTDSAGVVNVIVRVLICGRDMDDALAELRGTPWFGISGVAVIVDEVPHVIRPGMGNWRAHLGGEGILAGCLLELGEIVLE